MEVLQKLSDRFSTQNAQMHENTGKNQEGQDLVALIQERFGLLSQEMNASVLILAPIAPALSGSSPALPLNEPMPC